MIFVTGGTGLVGSHLLYYLTKAGQRPLALRRKSSNTDRVMEVFSYYSKDYSSQFQKITWIEGDILDYDSLLDALKGVTNVYHCAASVSFQSSDRSSLSDTNIIGTTNIVNACLESNVHKLLHVSTIGALGRAESDGIVTEESHWNNKKSSVYSTSKYQAEMQVWRGIAEGLNAVIINPSIILGPGDWNSGSSKLFTTMFNGLKFYSTGTNGFVDVDDVANAMIKLMNDEICGERYILNSENISYRDLFTWMADELGVPPPAYKATKLMSEIGWRGLWLVGLFTGKKSSITKETAETANQNYQYSNDKIKGHIGFSFIPVKESIKKNSRLFLESHNK